MTLELHPVDPSRREDFLRLHSEPNGLGWCRCVAWWVPTWDGWGERTAEQNCALRDSLFDRGEFDVYLLYEDGEPVGSCQCGPRDRLEKLRAGSGLAPDPDVWALSCFAIAPDRRGRGLLRELVSRMLETLRAQGVERLQAFPRRGEGLEAGEVWTGPEALFVSLGFRLVKEGERRCVYELAPL